MLIDCDNFEIVAKPKLLGMRLFISARHHVRRVITSVTSHTVPTGIGNVVGNKGGVAVSCSIDGTRVCFINCHLAAHREEKFNKERLRNMSDILLKSFSAHSLAMHHHIIVMGDLNFRLNPKVVAETKLLFQKLDANLQVRSGSELTLRSDRSVSSGSESSLREAMEKEYPRGSLDAFNVVESVVKTKTWSVCCSY